jgi:hypothetical protein
MSRSNNTRRSDTLDQTATGTAVTCVVVLVSEEGTSDSERAPRVPAGGGGGEGQVTASWRCLPATLSIDNGELEREREPSLVVRCLRMQVLQAEAGRCR